MASYKNQHFVPRCYLKAFSVRGQGHAINLFNIDRQVDVKNAPIKNQCSRDYFYDKSGETEKWLGRVETGYSAAIIRLINNEYTLDDGTTKAIRRFLLLQYLRTEAAAQRAASSMGEVADIAEIDGRPSWKDAMKIAVLIGLETFAKKMNIVDDLKMKLLLNATEAEFITSDDPVVLTNRWYTHERLAAGKSAGLVNSGAMMICPITPSALCILYDRDIYSVSPTDGRLHIHDVEEIHLFNQFQLLHCNSNIYFRKIVSQDALRRYTEEWLPRRPASRYEIVTAIMDYETDFGKHYRVIPRDAVTKEGETLIHIRSIQPIPTRWPSTIKWRYKKVAYSNGSGTGFVRRSYADPRKGYQRIK